MDAVREVLAAEVLALREERDEWKRIATEYREAAEDGLKQLWDENAATVCDDLLPRRSAS